MEENGTADGQEEDLEFMTLAKQINSTLDPDQTEQLKEIEVLNIFCQNGPFCNEEFIPVGSCIDGSKVNLPNDSGDIDVLIVPNKVILKESLFDYDRRYPAFLHIRVNEEHEQYFRTEKNPINGIYLPATVLKQVHESFFFLCRLILISKTREGISKDGRLLNVTRTSAVGKELITLNAEKLDDLGVKNVPYSPGISKLGQFGSQALIGIMNMANNGDDEGNGPKSRNVNSNSPSFVETLNKFLDTAETKQGDCKTDDRNSHTINQKGQSVCLDDNISALPVDPVNETVGMNIRNDSSSVTNDGYLSKNSQKKGNSSLENELSQECSVSTDLISGEAKTIQISTNDNPFQHETSLPMTKRRLSEENPGTMNKVSSKSTEKATEYENTKTKHPFLRLKSTDFVPAYKFEGWPRPAEEWVARSRKWPSKTVVRKVLECGCHVVAKRPLSMYQDTDSSVTDETDAYFRLSFSESEIILVQNMKERQMLCWRVLKAYQKCFLTSEKKFLTSYHWKNVVFWVSEDVGDLFWEKESVLAGVVKCLDFMIDCLRKKHLPFYFVRQMNLFDGCDENLLESMMTRVVEIHKEPLDFLKLFICNPPNPETYMLNIGRVKNILSKEKKSEHIDTVFEGMSSCLFSQFHNWLDSNAFDDEKFEKFRGTFSKLIKKARTDENANSSDAMKGMTDNENNFKEMFLNHMEMISDSMVRKDNGSDVSKSASEFFDTLAYKVKASGDCGEHSDEKKIKAASDFCSHIASSFLELSKEDGVDDSTVLAGIHKGSKALIEGNMSEHDGNKESREWDRVQAKLVGAFPKFIEAIQKSVGKGNTDFSLPAELRKIINSTSQEVEAVLESENERTKIEMDIDLD